MKYIITENKMTNVVEKFLKFKYPSLSEVYYDWAEYHCGMGVCCDPYAIGFTLPENEYNNYFIKLVDGGNYDANGDYRDKLSDELPEVCYEQPNLNDPRFTKYIISEDLFDDMATMFGGIKNWREPLLSFLNKQIGTNAKQVQYLDLIW